MALGYLLLVAVTVLFVAFTFVVHDPDDGANMSGVWLLMVTLPFSLLTALLVEVNGWLAVLGLAAAALLNAGLLYLIGVAADRGKDLPRPAG